jgi:hypothetical protein
MKVTMFNKDLIDKLCWMFEVLKLYQSNDSEFKYYLVHIQ